MNSALRSLGSDTTSHLCNLLVDKGVAYRTERGRYHTCLEDQLKKRRRAPMSIDERGIK